MVSRREFIGISAGVVGGLVVGVGGTLLARPSTISTTTTTEGGTGTVTQTITQSQTSSAVSSLANLGTIVVGADISGADSLDPAITEDADACWIPIHNAYQKPLQWTYPNFSSLVGELFSGYSLASDNVTYTLSGFNSSAKFANGDPMTVNDVVYTFQRGLAIGGAGIVGVYESLNNLTNPASITAPDSSSVQFVLSSPTAPSLVYGLLPEVAYCVVNQKQLSPNASTSAGVSDQGSAWSNAGNSAGSGPFVITSWVKDTQITMVANTNYAGNNPLQPNNPKLKQVIFRHVPDAATQLSLLQSGEIDVMWNPTPAQITSQQFVEGYNVESHLQCAVYAIFLNTVTPPLNNPMVRQAMKWAIDYNSLWNSILVGVSSPLQTLGPAGVLGADPSTPFSLNPTMAKSLLSQAGFPNGISITMLLPAADSLVALAAPAVQSTMAQCGINVTLQNVDESTLFTDWVGGNFEAIFYGEGGGLDHIFDVDFECLAADSQVFGTWAHYNDSTINSLFAASEVPTLTNAQFAAIQNQITEYALNNSPFIPTWQWVTTAILSSSVQSLPVPYGRLHVDYGRAYKQGISGFS